jgi:response regulator RpfG family c-di-GMP phosphodiesterase
VADLSRKLAIRLGLDGKAQQDIFVAGLLHDIGKIGFSDAMLVKPVPKMNSEELTRYRKHAVAGQSALMPLAELREAAALIRSHHERFDGQGFPDTLAGIAIPLGARILAVANDYDALQIGTLSEKKFNADEAKAVILQSSGKRYCPQVVEALVTLLGQPREESGRDSEVAAEKLEPGMVLARDLVSRDGTLLLAADYLLDANLVREIQQYAKREGLHLTLYVRNDKKFA